MYGYRRQGASYGHSKVAGRQVLRKGLSPLVTTISTHEGAPVIVGIRWLTCAAICHNLLRSAGTITDDHAVARGATLRRQLVAVPARTARPQGRPVLHLIARWHWQHVRTRLWNAVMPIAADPPAAA